MTINWWVIMINTTNKCIYKYVHLLCYKQRSLLHVSATYCGHLQGSVLWRIYYSATSRHNTITSALMMSPHTQHINTKLSTSTFINASYIYIYFKVLLTKLFYICKLNYFDVLCNIFFKEPLPEDGDNTWLKHVAGYAFCNTINLYICICICLSYF
jgi:hypothetical protein